MLGNLKNTFLNNPWVKELINEAGKYFESIDNEENSYQNL